jgi:hypothetical protein
VTPRELEEYKALRATIRERGTARVWILLAGFAAWAGLTLATAALAQLPVATLLPLLALAVSFEISVSLHKGVERIGRYIQVCFENEQTDPGWEHYAMAYGRQFPGMNGDPLFALFFWIASVFNFIPVLTAGPVPLEWAVVGAVHALFIGRVYLARREAGRQRQLDLERFQQLRRHSTSKFLPASDAES